MLLFNPDTYGDLRNEYEELSNINEFSFDKLSTKELIFVWCMGNRTSPYWLNKTKKQKATRIEYCLKFSQLDKVLSEEDRTSWITGRLPDKIRDAVSRMESFRPDIRTKARIMAEHTFQEMWKSIHNPKTTVDERMKIIQSLPIVINSVEQGYGFKTEKISKSKTKGKAGKTLMDSVMSED